MMFANRGEAGRRLAAALAEFEAPGTLVLALPRGGVPVAEPVAAALGAEFDLALVRKVGAPMQPELAMGAIADGVEPVVVRNEDVIAATGTSETEFAAAVDAQRGEIARRRRLYRGGRPPAAVAGRTVILVDDGIATGATVRAALRALRRMGPARLILAVPVAPAEAIEELAGEADRIVCLETPRDFMAVGAHYRDFCQVEDREVVEAMARAAERRSAADSGPSGRFDEPAGDP